LSRSRRAAQGGERAYKGRLGKDRSPRHSRHYIASALNGTNDIENHVFANEARRQALLIAKFDNLGKGASGAAVQNLMLGR
jgi:N-acetyl-gamma-glutamylphosphate reductase